MKITRYNNGKKIEKQFLEEAIVSNELISGTIARVNKRVSQVNGKENH